MSAAEVICGGGDILLLCDHASAAIPAGIDLGVPAHVMEKHVAFDPGAAALTRALASRLDAPALLGTVSRLVIDLHREVDHPALMPIESDGIAVPGNRDADRYDRIRRFHAPYHAAIAAAIRARRPRLLVAIHSFTPRLESGGPPRSMLAGILYNRDDRAARMMLEQLRAAGIETGDNAPYSGQTLNTTLNRHGEANGIACVSIEIRNDCIAAPADVAEWATLVAPMIENARNSLASGTPSTQ